VAGVDGPGFGAFRGMVWEACVAALETMIAGGGLPGGGVVFAVSDGDEPVRDAAWIRRLNPADPRRPVRPVGGRTAGRDGPSGRTAQVILVNAESHNARIRDACMNGHDRL
jgi:hypothetical protein